MRHTVTLTLEVTYETNLVPISTLEQMLCRGVESMVQDGGLTGDTDAEVSTWSLSMEDSN